MTDKLAKVKKDVKKLVPEEAIFEITRSFNYLEQGVFPYHVEEVKCKLCGVEIKGFDADKGNVQPYDPVPIKEKKREHLLAHVALVKIEEKHKIHGKN